MADVDTLFEFSTRIAPDPVDVFEDTRAAERGLSCGPRISTAVWRQFRFALIEAATTGEPPRED